MNQDERRALLELLKEKSLRFGDFTLASGKKSDHYFDSKHTTLDGQGAWLTGRCLFALMQDAGLEPAAVGGMTLGADPIVTSIAIAAHGAGTPLRAFIVRKEPKGHGTMNQIEGPVREGEKVVVVDDVVTTAGSTLKAIAACERAGLQIAAVIALVDREEGGAEALSRWPFHPLFRKSELLQR